VLLSMSQAGAALAKCRLASLEEADRRSLQQDAERVQHVADVLRDALAEGTPPLVVRNYAVRFLTGMLGLDDGGERGPHTPPPDSLVHFQEVATSRGGLTPGSLPGDLPDDPATLNDLPD